MAIRGNIEPTEILRGKMVGFIVIDKTLTVAGACADAKATGDAIKAAQTKAEKKADEAKTAADNAKTAANNAGTAAENAHTAADNAMTAANNAQSTADNALAAVDGVNNVYAFVTTIGTTWSGTKAPYTQTISVPGMLSTDEPTIAMAASEDIDTAQREWAAFESVYCITTGNGNIKVYSMSKTTTPFKIQMLVVRQGAPGSGGYAAVLYPGTTGDVIAEVDGKAYAIDNAELGQQPSQEHMYSFEIL